MGLDARVQGHFHHLLTLKEVEGKKYLTEMTALAGSAPQSLMYVVLESCEGNLPVLKCVWRHLNASGYRFQGDNRRGKEGG